MIIFISIVMMIIIGVGRTEIKEGYAKEANLDCAGQGSVWMVELVWKTFGLDWWG